jgi:hypothetical protein
MSITVRTNNVPRDIIHGFELDEKERKEFDYLDWDQEDGKWMYATFFRYKGELYDLGEFVVTPDSLKPWHGYQCDSYFSGTVVKYVNHNEQVIVGTYTS